jgi:hypothetical protein
MVINFGFHNILESSWVAVQLVVSQGLISMELIIIRGGTQK